MRFNFNIDGKIPNFSRMASRFPELSARILGYIGKSLALDLYENNLSGQNGITYHPSRTDRSGLPLDKRGRRMSQYSISKRANRVTITSYPLNFFEAGRTLRSGRKEAGKYILKNFSSGVDTKLQSLANEGADKILKDWEEKYG